MLRAGVLVSGGGTNLQALLDDREKTYEVACVISSSPKAYALERAAARGVDAVCVRDSAGMIAFLRSHGADFVILAGYLRMLDVGFIRAFENRIINIHPSLIPSFCGKGYYGLKVHEAVIARGVKVTGATVHFVNEEYDAGPIISQKAVPVLPDDTPETLQRRVMREAEWVILPEAARLYAEGRLRIEGNKARIAEVIDE